MLLCPMQGTCIDAAMQWQFRLLQAVILQHSVQAADPSMQGPNKDALLQNAGPEAAMEWVLSHMEDPDFNEPLPAPSSAPTAAPQQRSQTADPEQVAMLGAMGFTTEQVLPILQEGAFHTCTL